MLAEENSIALKNLADRQLQERDETARPTQPGAPEAGQSVGRERQEMAERSDDRNEAKVCASLAELERANALLREREELMSAIHTNLVGTVVYQLVFAPNGLPQIAYISPNVESLLGVRAEDWVADPEVLFRLLDPADAPVVRAHIDGALRTGENANVAARLRHANGTVRWFQIRSRCVQRLPDGSQVRVGDATDVTPTKELERTLQQRRDELDWLNANLEGEVERRAAALLRSEQRYEDLVANINDAIIRADVSGRLVYANRRFLEWFGLEDRDVGAIQLADCVPPEWGERLRDRHHRRVRGEPVSERFEFEGVRADGRRFWLDAFTSLLIEDERIVGTQSVLRDITERKRSEQTLQNLFEFAPDALVLTDREGIIRLANHQTEVMFGWPRAELLGRPVEVLMVPDDAPGHVAKRERYARAATLRPMGPTRPNLRARRKDGTVIPVEIRLSPLDTHEGTMIAAVVRDVTERQKLERGINRAQRLEAIGTLAGGIAHDLNNALAPITMALGLLQATRGDDAELLDLLRAGAHRAAEMVRQLLTFAKGGSDDARRVSVRVAPLFEEVAKIVRGTFPKNIECRTRVAEPLPTVHADPTQLHQILLNLCVNARDAMPGGGALTLAAEPVTLDAAAIEAMGEPDAIPGTYLVLRVEDTGTGMPPDVLERIFEPFFTTKSLDKGTGLGLSTTRGIVKSHGGFVRASSQPGHGTSFAVYLPAEADARRAAIAPGAESAFHGTGERILLVDDEEAIRSIAQFILTRCGFEVLTASNGDEALTEVVRQGTRLSAVVTDLHMPGAGGIELARQLRRVRPTLPVVVASGLLTDPECEELRALGIDLTLSKPFTQEELLTVLRTALTR